MDGAILDEPLKHVLIFLMVICLIIFSLAAYKRTKHRATIGILGHSAMFIGSLLSNHGDIVKEMKTTVRSQVKKPDPRDKHDQNKKIEQDES